MTLDQLILNYELAKTNAARSSFTEERATNFDLAGYYRKRIRAIRAGAVPFWTGLPGNQFPSERCQ